LCQKRFTERCSLQMHMLRHSEAAVLRNTCIHTSNKQQTLHQSSPTYAPRSFFVLC